MSDLSLSVDLQGAKLAAALLGVSPLLAEQMSLAMNDIETTLAIDTVQRMHWKEPTGALEESVLDDSSSTTWSAEIGSSLPYTRRRDLGFSGADSLGRVYDDLGAYFLDDTLDAQMEYVEEHIKEAIERTFFGLAASLL